MILPSPPTRVRGGRSRAIAHALAQRKTPSPALAGEGRRSAPSGVGVGRAALDGKPHRINRWLGASRAPLTPTGHCHGALPPTGGEGKNISAVRAAYCICNCPGGRRERWPSPPSFEALPGRRSAPRPAPASRRLRLRIPPRRRWKLPPTPAHARWPWGRVAREAARSGAATAAACGLPAALPAPAPRASLPACATMRRPCPTASW